MNPTYVSERLCQWQQLWTFQNPAVVCHGWQLIVHSFGFWMIFKMQDVQKIMDSTNRNFSRPFATFSRQIATFYFILCTEKSNFTSMGLHCPTMPMPSLASARFWAPAAALVTSRLELWNVSGLLYWDVVRRVWERAEDVHCLVWNWTLTEEPWKHPRYPFSPCLRWCLCHLPKAHCLNAEWTTVLHIKAIE